MAASSATAHHRYHPLALPATANGRQHHRLQFVANAKTNLTSFLVVTSLMVLFATTPSHPGRLSSSQMPRLTSLFRTQVVRAFTP